MPKYDFCYSFPFLFFCVRNVFVFFFSFLVRIAVLLLNSGEFDVFFLWLCCGSDLKLLKFVHSNL